jgi:ketosteroid isomerase-like protein
MSEAENRILVERMFGLTEKGDLQGVVDSYHEDIVVEYPQSGERVAGRQNILEVYRNFPEGSPKFTIREIRAGGDLVVAEHGGEYPDGSQWFVASIYEVKDGKVVRETDYFSQSFEAPQWRAQWVQKG